MTPDPGIRQADQDVNFGVNLEHGLDNTFNPIYDYVNFAASRPSTRANEGSDLRCRTSCGASRRSCFVQGV